MKNIPQALKAKIATGSTEICTCWEIIRKDGESLAFTDHDNQISFDGKTFSPQFGCEGTLIETRSGLAPDNLEIKGVISSESIKEHDIEKGLYDGAQVKQWFVDWRSPVMKFLIFSGHFGEIKRTENSFQVEVLGISDFLGRKNGSSMTKKCQARLGDGRCGVNLTNSKFSTTGTILSVKSERSFTVIGLDSYTSGWFNNGVLRFGSDSNAPEFVIKTDTFSGSERLIVLWQAVIDDLEAGVTSFSISAGCDHAFKTCKDKFDNSYNFRGFPHIPGDDWLLAYPTEGGGNNGGSIFK